MITRRLIVGLLTATQLLTPRTNFVQAAGYWVTDAGLEQLRHAPAADMSPAQLSPWPVKVGSNFDAMRSTDWWSEVQGSISESEYRVTWQEQTYLDDVSSALQAPNRAHSLRTYFTQPAYVSSRVRLAHRPGSGG